MVLSVLGTVGSRSVVANNSKHQRQRRISATNKCFCGPETTTTKVPPVSAATGRPLTESRTISDESVSSARDSVREGLKTTSTGVGVSVRTYSAVHNQVLKGALLSQRGDGMVTSVKDAM